MGFFSWLGFGSPRDAPETKINTQEGLPEVTDNVRDSGQTFIFGRADSGERVDERSAMQISTVYACVRLLSETIAGLPLHLYRYKGKNDEKERAMDHPLYKLLYRQPNPEMTSFVFRETLMTHLLLWGNAYAQIVRDGNGFLCPNDVRRLENMDLIPESEGGDYFIVNGSCVRLKDVGSAYISQQVDIALGEGAGKKSEEQENEPEEQSEDENGNENENGNGNENQNRDKRPSESKPDRRKLQ